jgi:tetratricopeptide (TPR) repeat protein
MLKTKFGQLFELLNEKDKMHLHSLIPSRLLGGQEEHAAYFEMAMQGLIPTPEKIPVKQRLLMSDLYKMMEKWVVIKQSVSETTACDVQLLRFYRGQENEKLFREKMSDARRFADSNPVRNAAYYEHVGTLLFEQWEFDQLSNRFSNADAENIHRHREIALLSRQLMHTVSLAPQSALLSRQFDTSMTDHLLEYVQQKGFLDIPCIALYYFAMHMIRHPEQEDWFVRFSHGLDAHRHLFPDEELKTLYFQAINYCIRRHNLGDHAYSVRLLDYYKTALKEKYLLTNGHLSKNTYRNINTIAIRLGHYDEALHLSLTYVELLRKEDKKSAYNFNMANIFYAQKKYSEAIEALQEVDFDDHLSNLFAKTILMKIFYETGADRLLDAHLDAMQVYLTRKKIIGYHKNNYTKIIKFTRMLIRLNAYDRKAKEALMEKIRQEKLIPDRDWLLREVENKK